VKPLIAPVKRICVRLVLASFALAIISCAASGSQHTGVEAEPSSSKLGPGSKGATTQGTSVDTSPSQFAVPSKEGSATSEPSSEATTQLRASGSLDPDCVLRGTSVVLTVQTGVENAAVGYVAFYANGKDGAKYPYGDDLGGNAGGMTDESGRYEDRFIVSAAAPAGKARVHIAVGFPGGNAQDFEEFDVPFRVVKAPGDC